MDQLGKIYRRVNRKHLLAEKYPEMKAGDGKIHVLYLHCLLNSTGLYRIILPYLELNKTDTHSAVIGTIHKWKFSQPFEAYNNAIDKRVIEWADYIVFPALQYPFKSIYDNLKKVNPRVKIVFDINEFIINRHRISEKARKRKHKIVLSNLRYANLISCSTSTLANHYQEQLRALVSVQPEFAVIPNFISSHLFLRTPYQSIQLNQEDRGKIRIGIFGTPDIAISFSDLPNQIVSAFKQCKGKGQLVVIGWNGCYNGVDLFNEIEVEFHKNIKIERYYERLHDLNLDVVLMPTTGNEIKYGKSPIKYIEMAALGIAVITDQTTILSRVIRNRETGFIVDHKNKWKEFLVELLTNQVKYKEVGHYAKRFVWRTFSWDRFKADLLANTYT